MRIDHIFHHLNPFGGAEEHMVTLAVLQKEQGDESTICLIQAVAAQNQYAKRLQASQVPICQWPVWLSPLWSDWTTQERLLHWWLRGLLPVTLLGTAFLSWQRHQPWTHARLSVEGRLRMLGKRLLDPRHEQRLFLLLLAWRYRQARPDVLHVHSYGAGLEFVLQWAARQQLPVVYQEHSTPDRIERPYYRLPKDLNLATLIVAVSSASAQALRQLCQVTQPMAIVPPIVLVKPPLLLSPGAAKSAEQAIHVLTIARLSEEKGLCYLIEAAAHILADHPTVRFSIYGEGHLVEALQAQIDHAQLGQQVTLAGGFTREQLPEIMNSADIFVLPSITEGFPLALVEAMAWGCPIVATTVGGIPEVVEDGVTALLCPAREANALAGAILTLIQNPQQRCTLGTAARLAYEQGNLKPEAIAVRFVQLYREAIQRVNNLLASSEGTATR